MNRTALLLLAIGAAIPLALLAGRPHHAAPAIVAREAPPLAHPRRTPLALATPLVYIVGAVRRPGLYSLAAQSRIAAALAAAGGPAPDADLAAVDLAEHVRDGEMIAVPKVGEAVRSPSRARRAVRSRVRPSSNPGARTRTRKAPPGDPIDLNTADVAVLAALPGIGAGLAERIVRFRELNGPFSTLEDLADVAGMTPRRIDAIGSYLIVR